MKKRLKISNKKFKTLLKILNSKLILQMKKFQNKAKPYLT